MGGRGGGGTSPRGLKPQGPEGERRPIRPIHTQLYEPSPPSPIFKTKPLAFPNVFPAPSGHGWLARPCPGGPTGLGLEKRQEGLSESPRAWPASPLAGVRPLRCEGCVPRGSGHVTGKPKGRKTGGWLIPTPCSLPRHPPRGLLPGRRFSFFKEAPAQEPALPTSTGSPQGTSRRAGTRGPRTGRVCAWCGHEPPGPSISPCQAREAKEQGHLHFRCGLLTTPATGCRPPQILPNSIKCAEEWQTSDI